MERVAKQTYPDSKRHKDGKVKYRQHDPGQKIAHEPAKGLPAFPEFF
jgi:hypothetical protein